MEKESHHPGPITIVLVIVLAAVYLHSQAKKKISGPVTDNEFESFVVGQ